MVYVVLFTTGTFMSQLERGVSFRNSFYDFHKSMGVLSMALLTWRILVLLRVWGKKYTKRLPKFSWSWLKTLALHINQSVYFYVDSSRHRVLIIKFISSEQCQVFWLRLTRYFSPEFSNDRSRTRSTFLVVLYLSGICRAAYDRAAKGCAGKLAAVQTVYSVKA